MTLRKKPLPALHIGGLAAVALLLFCVLSPGAFAAVYAHQSPVQLFWQAATGDVKHYHVYVSVDGEAYSLQQEAAGTSCQMNVQDNRRYAIQVEAEGPTGLTGPRSDPSEEIVVFLNGSETDTDGDGMDDAWEIANGLNPFDPADAGLDRDGDGLLNREEFLLGTSPTDSDTDADGVSDGLEVSRNQNPLDPSDNRPVANAGNDRTRDPTRITLNGSGSYDPNGDPLSYSWSQVSGPAVAISDPKAASPTFLAKKSGPHVFRLTVSDGKAQSLPDEVTVTIRNLAPSAQAGPDQVVDAGTRVVLDGANSNDPNGDPLTYAWNRTQGPAVALAGATTQTASFTPDAAGLYTFTLVVNDGVNPSLPDEVNVVVNAANRVPTANAGPDQKARVKKSLRLDGSGSVDPDGDPLSYQWRQLEGPEAVFLAYSQAGPAVNPTFLPNLTGTYVFELKVSDGQLLSLPDTVNVIVEDENRAPTAKIEAVKPVVVGDRVTLDGRASTDPDGNPLNYQWAQTGGALVSLESEHAATTAFYAVSEGVLTFELVVDDGLLLSAPAVVQVTVNGANQVPVANAGKDFFGLLNKVNSLDGTASKDPDAGDVLTYQWSQVFGTKVTLQGADTAKPTFKPTTKGFYVFELRVSDGKLQSAADVVLVVVWW